MPIPSPFFHRTSPICESQEWRNWSGYLAAATYEPSHEREYFAIRDSAGLLDVSPLFKYDIVGPDSLRVVDKMMTRDISRCAIGQVMYSPWCDENGDMIDDGTIWRLSEDHFRITAADPSLRWFQDCAFGLEAEVRDMSTQLAALALQGPKARSILSRTFPDQGLEQLAYYHLSRHEFLGHSIIVTRTGYTGDLGYELWIDPEAAGLLWDHITDEGRAYGLLPAGLVALDMVRIEAGLLLIEVDYISARKALTDARKSSPYEAGLGWAVALDKGPFIGRRALAAEKAAGSRWAFVGLEIDWLDLERLFALHDLPPMVAGRASRDAVPVYNDQGRQVGQITSRTFSPVLKKYLALATVEKEYAKPGTRLLAEITVEFERRQAMATVVKKPFFDPPRKKS